MMRLLASLGLVFTVCHAAQLAPSPFAVMHDEMADEDYVTMEYELMRLLPRTWHLHVVNKRPGWFGRRQYTTSVKLLPNFKAKLRSGQVGEWKVKLGSRKGFEVHTLEVGFPGKKPLERLVFQNFVFPGTDDEDAFSMAPGRVFTEKPDPKAMALPPPPETFRRRAQRVLSYILPEAFPPPSSGPKPKRECIATYEIRPWVARVLVSPSLTSWK